MLAADKAALETELRKRALRAQRAATHAPSARSPSRWLIRWSETRN